MHSAPYARLALMTVLSYASMYALMYAMADTFANVIPNLNQAYMAGLMTAPMVALEMLIMGGMYANKRRNAAILAGAAVLGIACFFAIRTQAFIGDKQFLQSMIPHHAGAILMCAHASLADPGIQQLCANIRSGQQAEIDWMNMMLARMP